LTYAHTNTGQITSESVYLDLQANAELSKILHGNAFTNVEIR